MIRTIKKSKYLKIVASYLAIQMVLTTIQPMTMFALTSGPSQPEFNSFTPIGTSDMVNLSSGDFNYNIPIMDVGGYPLNLSYDAGITMDQEASWVGLGWNLNVGQINRQVRGLPDDFDGDDMEYEDNLKENKTVGFTFNFNPQFVGLGDITQDTNNTPIDTSNVGIGANFGLTIQHNNYTGVSFQPSYGLSFSLNENVSVGASLSSSAANGANVSARASLSKSQKGKVSETTNALSTNLGIATNTRQGLNSFNLNNSYNKSIESSSEKNQSFSNSGGGLSNGSSISLLDNTYTPSKRNRYSFSNITFSTSLGLDLWGIDAEAGLTGFASNQKIENNSRTVKAYGYNNTHLSDENGVLDFNREKENIVTKNTLVLPMTNYTYDLYQINGQGTGGMFRPFRSLVGQLYKNTVQDESDSNSFGGEFEGGTGWHVGLDYKNVEVDSRTGIWDSPVNDYFEENDNPNVLYEPFYYKSIGEFTSDNEYSIYSEELGENNSIRLGIRGNNNNPGKIAENKYYKKTTIDGNVTHDLVGDGIGEPIEREKRDIRNKAIRHISSEEANSDPFITVNQYSKPHHIAGYKTLNPDGSTYVYGEALYNISKKESTFAVDANSDDLNSPKDGTVMFDSNDNTLGNTRGTDHYYNSITTPEYAHTYLLTTVLSTDYEDLKNDGPTLDDLGSYTLFHYENPYAANNSFKWRTPYKSDEASYNAGLNTDSSDEKGSIIEGDKEIKYIKTIETKTHIAYFKYSNRLDGLGIDENKLRKLDKVLLFSLDEYNIIQDLGIDIDIIDFENDSNEDLKILMSKSIKIAHFNYDYILMSNTPNTGNNDNNDNPNNAKLTLTKLYFTYRNSFMGAHSPYKFNYENDNPDYALKEVDIWGNYKPDDATSYNVNDVITTQEFPFVQQQSKTLQDQRAASWSLSSIDLPSGGKIKIDYESDDYQYVQNRKAMQMFKIAGITKENNSPSGSDITSASRLVDLYQHNNYDNDARYLIVETPEESLISNNEFISKYIGDQIDKPIYFRFMLNMTKNAALNNSITNEYDYVTGYFKIDQNILNSSNLVFEKEGKIYGAIPMEFHDLESGINGDRNVNPISKAGWYFARKYLPKQSYNLPPYTSGSVKDIVNQLKNDFGAITEIFSGPNKKLRDEKFVAKKCIKDKSWIRLLEPSGTKLGGGIRVKKIEMLDVWDKMVGQDDNELYKQSYGQEYEYDLSDGTSSGVATYEPNLSKENPFVEPFYNGEDNIIAPQEYNYIEKPFGESFFPSPTITYSKVSVKNLQRVNDEDVILKKHATGKVINEFYTSKDFPTIVDYTELDGANNYYSNDDSLGSILGLKVDITTELTLSQGFVIETNDMNGKQKKQSVFNELGSLISSVETKYSVDETSNLLDNKIPVFDQAGKRISYTENNQVVYPEVATQYEVINDFNKSYTYTSSKGFQGNVAGIPIIFPIIIPMIVPAFSTNKNTLKTVTTTKVIHKSGIQTEKIAFDLGSTVSTKNIAWDASTGQVIVTKTTNEYNDSYYSTNFPSYWSYKRMGHAYQNLGVSGVLNKTGDSSYELDIAQNVSTIFAEGDELLVKSTSSSSSATRDRVWVVDVNETSNKIKLMNDEGTILSTETEALDDYDFIISRSGFRNVQTGTMASITSMQNPIDDDIINQFDFAFNEGQTQKKIINASAVEYSDFWNVQCEADIVRPIFEVDLVSGEEIYSIDDLCINPFLFNIKGDFKAKKSYAYLTGRYTEQNTALKEQGFFNSFSPFYTYDENQSRWIKSNQSNEWTFASEVTSYSAYGAELENRDALGRYSSAQYGYDYTLPTAVSSNAAYNEMGFDGFEDYDEDNPGFTQNTHFGYQDEVVQGNLSNKAHTGRRSIRVPANSSITLSKSLENCNN